MSNWICKNAYLSTAEMQNNANIIYNRLKPGWTKNAICALLANMQCESNINPGIWESLKSGNLSGGFGLVQWTPATKYRNWHDAYFGDSDYANGDKQLSRIIYEVNSGLQWAGGYSEQGLTFREFTQSTLDPAILAVEFLICYERPREEYQTAPYRALRGSIAKTWWNYFGGTSGGEDPEDSGGTITPPVTPVDPPSVEIYTISVTETDGGICRTDTTSAYSGETVTIVPTPDYGYYTDSVTITGDNGNTYSSTLDEDGVYRFIMPSCNVEIYVTFSPGGSGDTGNSFPIWLLFKLRERRL